MLPGALDLIAGIRGLLALLFAIQYTWAKPFSGLAALKSAEVVRI
jgi:hypothetical protein